MAGTNFTSASARGIIVFDYDLVPERLAPPPKASRVRSIRHRMPARAMNVLVVHEVDWLAKVVYELHNLSESLSLLGHSVYAIDYENTWRKDGLLQFGSLKTQELGSVSRAFADGSVYLRRPGFIRIPGLSRLSAWLTHYWAIRRTIRDKHIDVILLYGVPTNGLQATFLARRSNIPVVFRSIDILHKLVPHSVPRGAGTATLLSRASDKLHHLVPYYILRPVTRVLERRVYSTVDLILGITPHHTRYVVDLGAQESKVKLLLMPIDTTLFRPSADSSEISRKWGLTENDKVVVFVGTLFEFSGLDGFLREFPRILQHVPEAKLLIVGDGAQRQKLEAIIVEVGLQGKVIITGFEPYRTMPEYMNVATVCINPFLITEATNDIFPGKVVQYIACGKATVATPTLGLTTLLPDNTYGVLYASDAEDMAAKVILLLKSPDRRRQLEHAGLDYVRREHDYMAVARRLEAELVRLVEAKRGRPLSVGS